jgi:hypothetical protein
MHNLIVVSNGDVDGNVDGDGEFCVCSCELCDDELCVDDGELRVGDGDGELRVGDGVL